MQFFMTRTAPKPSSGPVIKRLLIRCDSTAKLMPTGQTIKEELWETAKVKSQKLTCPHCQKVHTWSKKDVVLAR